MRLKNLQALRGFAALAIVVIHICLWERKLPPYRPALPMLVPGQAGVDLFFVISGFIMVFIQPAPIGSWRGYGSFMGHRLARIYPPLWLILVPLTVLWIFEPAWFNHNFDNHVDLVGSYLLLPQAQVPLLTVSWTLIHEIYFYWVVSVALCFAPRGRLVFGVAWFVVVLAGFIAHGSVRDEPVFQLVFSPFSLTFLLGYFLGLGYERLKRFPRDAAIILVVVGLLAILIGGSFSPVWPGSYPNNNSLARLACFGLPSALIVAGAVALERHWALGNRWVQLLGDASYSIYLLHILFVMAIYHVAYISGYGRQDWALAVAAVATLGTGIGVGVGFHLLLERPACRWVRRGVDYLFGEPAGHRAGIGS